MLILNNLDALRMTTSTAATVDVHASWSDLTTSTGAVAPNRTNTAFSSASTSDIVGTPSSGVVRNVKTLHIRNKDASVSCDVTVFFNQNGTTFETHKATLIPGATLEYIEGVGFFTISSNITNLKNFSNANQTSWTADQYITGSSIAIPANLPIAGTTYKLVVMMSKTAAGTATPTFNLRYGTAGAIGDTSRCSIPFTVLTTTAADAARWDFVCVFRTIGSGTSAVIQANGLLLNNLATTGFAGTTAIKSVDVTSGGFDSTVANSFIGMSYNGGTGAVHTVTEVRAELIA